MNKSDLKKELSARPGYLKKSPNFIQRRFNVSYELALETQKEIKSELRNSRVTPAILVSDSSEPFKLNAWNKETGKMMSISEYCTFYNIPLDDITTYNLITHTGTPYYNIRLKSNILNADYEDLESKFNSYLSRLPQVNKKAKVLSSDTIADRLIITDIHIGMEPNQDNTSIFKFKWNKEVLMNTADIIIEELLQNQTSTLLIIDDLGDYPDGFQGKTTRGGHSLPQNMSDIDIFGLGIEFKLYLIDNLRLHYDNIINNNVCEDNHGGIFTKLINEAFKKIIDVKYDDVEVVNHYDFFSHYIIGNHAKILCHGKDSKDLKFGLGTKLTPEIASKIDQYIDFKGIKGEAKYIEFSKGDSHQCLFDMASSDNFNYMNYPALSPSSQWVQTNFKKGRRGFVIENIDNNSNSPNFKIKFID